MTRHTQWRTVAAGAAVALLAACSDVTDPATAPSPVVRQLADASPAQQAQVVARGIAAALERPNLRAQLRNDMRDSRWTEHKLVLQDYVATPHGADLVTAAARELGVTPAALGATIAALPRLDFYLPFRPNRLAWRGSPDLLVAAAFEKMAPTIDAFDTRGATHTLRLADGAPARPLILLGPAEPKGELAVGARAGAETIEGPGENGTTGITNFEGFPNGSGPTLVQRMAVVCDQPDGCPDAGGSSPAPPPPPPPPTSGIYITHYNIQKGDGWWGGLEMQFHSKMAVPADLSAYPRIIYFEQCPAGTVYQSGVHEDVGWDGSLYLSAPYTYCYSTHGTPIYLVQIEEIDGGLTLGNDDYGTRFYNVPGNNPYGATFGPVMEFYDGTSRTAYLRLEKK